MKYALLIGINYSNTDYALKGCINDVDYFKTCMVNHFGYEERDIMVLTDFDLIDPTKSNIIRIFSRLIAKCKSGDHLCFMFSGHGAQINEDTMLLTKDLQFINRREILDLLKLAVPDVSIRIFLDCCYVGSMSMFEYNVQYQTDAYLSCCIRRWLNHALRIDNDNDMIVFAACTRGTKTVDLKYTPNGFHDNTFSRNGVFTSTLLQIIHDHKHRKLTNKSVVSKISKRFFKAGLHQIPQCSFSRKHALDQQFFI